MNRLTRLALCYLLLLTLSVSVCAEDKPLEPLSPIVQKYATTLVLPSEDYQLIPNPEGGLLLLCGDRLAWLADDGVTLLREKKLPRHYIDLAVRDGYFVAVSQQDSTVEILDAKTFEARSSVTLTTKDLYRVTPHPKIPVSYITTDNGKIPFAMFDELTGELRSDNDWLARDLIVDPTGTFMIGGYLNYVKVGERVEVIGRNILTSPEYEAIKKMYRYHLDRSGKPVLADTVENLSGGYREIVASPDARQVAVMSYGQASVGGFDALDFQKLPTGYSVKEGGTPMSLDYHPVVPMVGSPGQGGGVFFHSESGRLETNRLKKPNLLDPEQAYDKLHFSPDGESALLLYKVEYKNEEGKKIKPTTRVLVATPLALSKPELAMVARGPAEPKAVILPELVEVPIEAGEKLDLHAQMQRESMEWIKANSIFGPESRLSADVIRSASAFLNEGRGFWMMLDGGLTKTGKTTVIAVHQGVFMSAELTDEQAKVAGIEEMTLVKTPGQVFENKEAPRRLLRIESVSQEPSTDGKIKGEAILTKLGDRSNALFAMMYTTIHDEKIKTSIHHMTNWITDERSERSFSFTNPAKDDKPVLLIGFLQVESFDVSRRTPDLRTKLSDPTLFITIQQPREVAE